MTCIVLLAAAGGDWEPGALAVLERAAGVVVLKRCVDVDDLLATAASGQAEAAVLAADLPGLDARVVDQLRHQGVRAGAVVPPGSAGEAARTRATRAGLTSLVAEDGLDALPAAVQAVVLAAERAPRPAAEPVRQEHEPVIGGGVVAVWGPAGAPGRTTLATGIACELAARRLPTVLLDADPAGGAVATLLGIVDEVSGLLAAGRLAVAGDLPAGLPGVLRGCGPHLGVVTGLPRAERWAELRPGLVHEIAESGRSHGHVVVDTGAGLEDDGATTGRGGRHQLTLDAIDAADVLVVVGTPDPVGLSRLARGLADLRESTSSLPHVVVNRMRPSLGWSEREVVEALAAVGHPGPVRFLPDDPPTVDRAAVSGRSLRETAPEAALTRAIGRLVDAFAPRAAAPGVRRRRAARARRW
jgi:MinD-like ATPase involved in chromosome partitioning or flagellar assembly